MTQLLERPAPARQLPATVLLVDGDATGRELCSQDLSRLGYSVRTVSGGDEAIRAVSSEMPDAVVLDIVMAKRDGLGVLQELLAMEPSLPVVIHTANPDYRQNFLAWLADAYVDKGADIRPLARAIEEAIARRTK